MQILNKFRKKVNYYLNRRYALKLIEVRERYYKEHHEEKSVMKIAFRNLEVKLRDIRYPDNYFNKIMSMLLSDIELFEQISKRYKSDRELIRKKHTEDNFIRHFTQERNSYPAYPNENEINNSIKIDAQSLFVFGMIIVNRLSLLLKLYISDRNKILPKHKDMFSKIGWLFKELSEQKDLSELGTKFRDRFMLQIKWIYAVLRFYRNEFIEHLDKGYQQGMSFQMFGNDFSLSSCKWNYDESDNQKIDLLRNKLINEKITLAERDGHRGLINRYYIQQVFNNITLVPNNLINESLKIIEEVGVDSPGPEKVIKNIEGYTEDLLKFMCEELEKSELEKYRVNK